MRLKKGLIVCALILTSTACLFGFVAAITPAQTQGILFLSCDNPQNVWTYAHPSMGFAVSTGQEHLAVILMNRTRDGKEHYFFVVRPPGRVNEKLAYFPTNRFFLFCGNKKSVETFVERSMIGRQGWEQDVIYDPLNPSPQPDSP